MKNITIKEERQNKNIIFMAELSGDLLDIQFKTILLMLLL
jgi:hypothetical protein